MLHLRNDLVGSSGETEVVHIPAAQHRTQGAADIAHFQAEQCGLVAVDLHDGLWLVELQVGIEEYEQPAGPCILKKPLRHVVQTRKWIGRTDDELDRAERRFGIEFADDHRAFLTTGLPVGQGWPDWRDGDADEITHRLCRPVEGVLFDVAENGFWYESWGPRPDDPDDAVALADRRLRTVPRLIPVYGHRYLPAGRGSFANPVLSVVQTDIIIYGTDLNDYIGREFEPNADLSGDWKAVDFWGRLVG